MDKNTIVKVTNRDNGKVGYYVPDLGIRRQFMPKETKEITFEELQKLSYLEGGNQLLQNYLVINDKTAMEAILSSVEPEYFYTEEDIKHLLLDGSIDEFLDCLDFAPKGVIDILKDLAVSLPLNDMQKREAILKKTGFNVTNAIAIQNTKYDGEAESAENEEKAKKRRVAKEENGSEHNSGRRTAPPKYKVISE